LPGSSRGSFHTRVIATNQRARLFFILRDAGPFGHGGAASLALEPSPFITRVFVLDVRKPHGRAASCTEGMDDFVDVRRFLILMNL
jgi:hypothetical protein